MDQARLIETLKKIPVLPLVLLAAGYLGYDYYTFTTDPSSPLLQKQGQRDSVKKENLALKAQVQKAQDFFKQLDAKKESLKALSIQLSQMRSTLSDTLDIPQFIKMVITEASKVGIRVLSIRPTDAKKNEYYVEQAFDVSFKGVYVQLLVFLGRLSELERIIRVDSFDIRRTGSSAGQYVELGGVLQVKAYKYLGSKADEVAPRPDAVSPIPQTPSPPTVPPGGGK